MCLKFVECDKVLCFDYVLWMIVYVCVRFESDKFLFIDYIVIVECVF